MLKSVIHKYIYWFIEIIILNNLIFVVLVYYIYTATYSVFLMIKTDFVS